MTDIIIYCAYVVELDVSLSNRIVSRKSIVVEYVQVECPIVQFLHCETCNETTARGSRKNA